MYACNIDRRDKDSLCDFRTSIDVTWIVYAILVDGARIVNGASRRNKDSLWTLMYRGNKSTVYGVLISGDWYLLGGKKANLYWGVCPCLLSIGIWKSINVHLGMININRCLATSVFALYSALVVVRVYVL